jgi:hypothetical protein
VPGRVFNLAAAKARGVRLFANMAVGTSAVLLTHLGRASIATRAAFSRMAAGNVLAMLQDRRPPNLVNPTVWNGTGPGSDFDVSATSGSLPA